MGLKFSCPVAMETLSTSVDFKKNHKNQDGRIHTLYFIVSLVIGITMVVIGVQNQETCQNDGAHYLVVNGSYFLVVSVLGYIGGCIDQPTFSKLLVVACSIPGLVIHIWGSFTIFGKLGSSKSKKTKTDFLAIKNKE